MVKDYIATFFSHFGAIRFQKQFQSQVEDLVLMPVPRHISSSCGTCARFRAEEETILHLDLASCLEFDQLYDSTSASAVVLDL